jgi:DNA-binding winged helix-turn-helix (wHTH) protein
MSDVAPSSIIQLGGAVLDPVSRELVVDGAPTRLEPRLFAVLMKLASADGGAVGRDQLLECWPDASGSDEALTQVISSLRRILGDTKRPHRLIITLPKSGYRLVAKRAQTSPNSKSVGPGANSVAQAILDRPFTTLAIAAGVATIVITSVAAIEAITDRPPRPDIVLQIPVESRADVGP